jgi:hypothetical protein
MTMKNETTAQVVDTVNADGTITREMNGMVFTYAQNAIVPDPPTGMTYQIVSSTASPTGFRAETPVLPPVGGDTPDTPNDETGGTEFNFNGVTKTKDQWLTHRLTEKSKTAIKKAMTNSGYFQGTISDNAVASAWSLIVNYAATTGGFNNNWDLSNNLGNAALWVAQDPLATTLFPTILTSPKDKTGILQNEKDYAIALKRFAIDNGIYLSDAEINTKAKAIANASESNPITLESVKQTYRVKKIAPKFKQYSDQILAGNDVRDLASDYLQMMAQTLEIDPDTINLAHEVNQTGSLLNKALIQNKEPDYTDFNEALKKDFRWKYTSNANQTMSDLAGQIKQMFGF